MFEQLIETSQKQEVSIATLATHGKKENMKEPQHPLLMQSSYTFTLYPLKLKDGEIEYNQVKCNKSKPLSSASAILTPQLQGDLIKLQDLFSQVLTITLECGIYPTPHQSSEMEI